MINNRQNGRRRGRGGQPQRNGQPNGQNNGSRVDNRARGNAAQLFEKYKTLARDAQMQGDRVNSEYYFQFADHYFRVLSENRSRYEEQRRPRDEYGNEEGGDQAERGYQQRDGNDDGWDDPYDTQDAPMQAEPQRGYQQQRDQRAPYQGRGNDNRDDGGRHNGTGNGNGNGAQNGGMGQRGNGNPMSAPMANPMSAPMQRGTEADEPRLAADALPPRIEPERMASHDGDAPQRGMEGDDAGDDPAPKRRRGRKPRIETAPAEA